MSHPIFISSDPNILLIYKIFPSHLHPLIFSSIAKHHMAIFRQPLSMKFITSNITLDFGNGWNWRWNSLDNDLFFSILYCYHCELSSKLHYSEKKIHASQYTYLQRMSPGFLIFHVRLMQLLDLMTHSSYKPLKNNKAISLNNKEIETFRHKSNTLSASLNTCSINKTKQLHSSADTFFAISSSFSRDLQNVENFEHNLRKLCGMLHAINNNRYRQFCSYSKHDLFKLLELIFQAVTSNTSICDLDSCKSICDIIQDILPLLTSFKTEIGWEFWLEVIRRMLDSHTILIQIRALSLLYNIWSFIPLGKELYIFVTEWLLCPEIWQKFFMHYSSWVRCFYMHFICWKVIRWTGTAVCDQTQHIIHIVLSQLLRTFNTYNTDNKEAVNKASLPLPMFALNQLPNRRLVIARFIPRQDTISKGFPRYSIEDFATPVNLDCPLSDDDVDNLLLSSDQKSVASVTNDSKSNLSASQMLHRQWSAVKFSFNKKKIIFSFDKNIDSCSNSVCSSSSSIKSISSSKHSQNSIDIPCNDYHFIYEYSLIIHMIMDKGSQYIRWY